MRPCSESRMNFPEKKIKPKILCICALPPPYHGVSVTNELLLTNKLVQKKYELTLVPLNKPKIELGGELSWRTLSWDLGVTFKILRAIVRWKPQVIYFSLAQTKLGLIRGACWIWLATLGGCKCLVHLHGANFRTFYEGEISSQLKKILQPALSRLAGVIVLDRTLVRLFDGLVPDRKVFILRNGVPSYITEADFVEAMRRRGRAQKLQVTFLSNLIPEKGFRAFLETAAFIKQRGYEKDFLFNLAGAAPSPKITAEVEEFIDTHSLRNFFRILGIVTGAEKWRLLLASDVLVLPTRLAEGQPIAIIEAMAAGLPIVTTVRGGIPAMIKEGINGFLLAPGDATEIAAALLLLKSEAQLRLSMSIASRRTYQECYTEEMFVRGFSHIVDLVLEKNH